jgi:hypothetical protein
MSNKFQTFAAIMAFYIFLSYLAFPMIFFYFVEKSYASAGDGFILGSLISIGLWQFYGKTLI